MWFDEGSRKYPSPKGLLILFSCQVRYSSRVASGSGSVKLAAFIVFQLRRLHEKAFDCQGAWRR